MMSSEGWTTADLPSMAGRRVIVTGGNSGVGLATVQAFAEVGASVVLACRDVSRGREAARAIGGDVIVRELDLADLASIRAFAEGWNTPLDILINNAGVMMVPRATTADGFELQFGTNHLGHFALTNLLLPVLRDRVVTVSSQAHRFGRIDAGDLNWERRRYSAVGAYCQSKLANLLFTLELQRRLDQSHAHLRALAAHPGFAATNLQRHSSSRPLGRMMDWSSRFLAQSPEQAAWSPLFAATQPVPGATYVGPDEAFERRGHPARVGRSARARDPHAAEDLWHRSEELTGITFPWG